MSDDLHRVYKKQIAELKTLVLLMHGDRRLPNYWQDMANDILSDEEERKQRERECEECEEEEVNR